MKPAKKSSQNPRMAALDAISEVLDDHRSLAESAALSRLKDSRDNALARHLAYGVLRWLNALSWMANKLLSKPLKSRDRDVQRLILLGLQQLWHDATASHAAVNETAECARLMGKPWAVGLVNAVLRRFQREQAKWLEKLEGSDNAFAHPKWLLNDLRRDWPDSWADIAKANNQQAPLWLRINRLKANESTLMAQLKEAGFEVQKHPYAADAISITPAAPVAKIPGFADGWLSVQDPAAQLARDLVDPQPGELILDACAAPGGKTAHLLESCPEVHLTVLDQQAKRVEQINETMQRLGLKAEPKVADSSNPESWWDKVLFDKILLDAPCSATGVIRRHPEIKWLRSSEKVDAVIDVQAGLLEALWPLLKPGGVMVYATCSLMRCENDQQISRFMDQHNDAALVKLNVDWGTALEFGRQIKPGEADMDGFFYAKLQKST